MIFVASQRLHYQPVAFLNRRNEFGERKNPQVVAPDSFQGNAGEINRVNTPVNG
jgi:hypothetical protein